MFNTPVSVAAGLEDQLLSKTVVAWPQPGGATRQQAQAQAQLTASLRARGHGGGRTGAGAGAGVGAHLAAEGKRAKKLLKKGKRAALLGAASLPAFLSSSAGGGSGAGAGHQGRYGALSLSSGAAFLTSGAGLLGARGRDTPTGHARGQGHAHGQGRYGTVTLSSGLGLGHSGSSGRCSLERVRRLELELRQAREACGALATVL